MYVHYLMQSLQCTDFTFRLLARLTTDHEMIDTLHPGVQWWHKSIAVFARQLPVLSSTPLALQASP